MSHLSRDLIQAIKHYSFNNLSEFYRRNKATGLFTMSYVTFSRAMSSREKDDSKKETQKVYLSDATIREIEFVATQLNLYNHKTGSSDYLGRIAVISGLCELLDTVIKKFDVQTWSQLVKYYVKFKSTIKYRED